MVNIRININTLSSKEKVLCHLIEDKTPQSIRVASHAIALDYKNTYNAVQELGPAVHTEKLGNTNLIKLNLSSNPQIYKVEHIRTETYLLKHPKFKLIKEDSVLLNYPFIIVVLFGSYVSGNTSPHSDIDICVIGDNDKKIKELVSKFKLLPLPLEIHEFSSNEFESMLKTKEANIANEIVKKNIILYGIENYYNLVAPWMKKE